MNIKVNELKISYVTYGSGDPTILVHGWGGNKQSLDALARELAKTRKVYLLDLPGFGESQNPRMNWEAEQYPETVLQFIRQLKLNKLVYIGHSFGGGIGIYLAANHPALFEKLVLIAASYYREPKVSGLGKLTKFVPFYDHLRDYLLPVRRLYYKLFHRRSDSLKYLHLESIYRKILKMDLRPILRSVHLPTLILWGRHDLSTPIAEGKYLNEKITDSKMKIYENMTHNLPIAEPVEVANDIIHFLKES